jgi:hypothetical protein
LAVMVGDDEMTVAGQAPDLSPCVGVLEAAKPVALWTGACDGHFCSLDGISSAF